MTSLIVCYENQVVSIERRSRKIQRLLNDLTILLGLNTKLLSVLCVEVLLFVESKRNSSTAGKFSSHLLRLNGRLRRYLIKVMEKTRIFTGSYWLFSIFLLLFYCSPVLLAFKSPPKLHREHFNFTIQNNPFIRTWRRLELSLTRKTTSVVGETKNEHFWKYLLIEFCLHNIYFVVVKFKSSLLTYYPEQYQIIGLLLGIEPEF